MKGLAATRVIVVDDRPDEALPIIKAFSKKGISIAFFDGELENLPQEHLTGVRLAILDMNLVDGTDDKSKITTLVNYLKGILGPDNGPYAVIAWTQHRELVDLFEQYIFLEDSVPTPVFSLILTKEECKGESSEIISGKLAEVLGKFSPLLFLQNWEESCFLAATEVTNGLSALVTLHTSDIAEYRRIWKEQFLQLLHSMAEAQAEQHLDANTCLSAVYGALRPLYADRMESHAAHLSESLLQSSEEIMKASADCTIDKKAKINSMLHLSFVGLDRFSGGYLYMFPGEKPGWLPDGRQLIEDCVQGTRGKPDPEKVTILEQNYIPVLIEINANCDHAQKNIRIARFLFGMILPAVERSKIKRNAEFIWEFGPVFLEKNVATGEYFLYLSARHLVSHELEEVIKMPPFARLRGQALADLQAWFARHSARPGMVLLR